MIDVEPLILEELERLSPHDPFAGGDWQAVLAGAYMTRRAGVPSRRLLWVAFAIVVLMVAVAAPALGLQPGFLDFFSTKHASKRVVHGFAVMNVGAPRGMSPQVIAGQTRLVTTYHLRNGKAVPLWVAPTRSGGFCYLLGYGGGCDTRNSPTRSSPGDINATQLDVSRLGSNIIAGSVGNEKTARLELRFLHGQPISVPLLWVSAPINRGFFFYELTRPGQTRSHRVTAVVARDDKGRVLAQVSSLFRLPPAWENPNAVSNRADRHTILRSGNLATVIAQARTGGSCWWLQHRSQTIGSGCAPPRVVTTPMAGGLNHGTGFTSFSAQVKPDVDRVVLRFQDNDTVTLRPVDGFVLFNIPEGDWPTGHRLTSATAYTANDKKLSSEHFDPLQAGDYSCTKTIPTGAGERACP